MKKSRFTESQIIGILKEVKAGRTLEVCCEHGISEQTLYRERKKYGGMEASEAKRLRELEEGNQQLKRIVADRAVDMVALLSRICQRRRPGGARAACGGAQDECLSAARSVALHDRGRRLVGR